MPFVPVRTVTVEAPLIDVVPVIEALSVITAVPSVIWSEPVTDPPVPGASCAPIRNEPPV